MRAHQYPYDCLIRLYFSFFQVITCQCSSSYVCFLEASFMLILLSSNFWKLLTMKAGSPILKNSYTWERTLLLTYLVSYSFCGCYSGRHPYRSPCSPFPEWPRGPGNNVLPHRESSWSLCLLFWPAQSLGFSMYNQTWLQCYLVLSPDNKNKRRN